MPTKKKAADYVSLRDVNSDSSGGRVHFSKPVVELQLSKKLSQARPSRGQILAVNLPGAVFTAYLVSFVDISCWILSQPIRK